MNIVESAISVAKLAVAISVAIVAIGIATAYIGGGIVVFAFLFAAAAAIHFAADVWT